MSAPLHDMDARLDAARRRLALRRHEMQKLQGLARHGEALDGQLPLFSRRGFMARIAKRLKEAGRTGRYGLVGLQALDERTMRLACELINRETRAADIAGRLGRLRIGILLDDCDLAGAQGVAARLRRRLGEAARAEGLVDGWMAPVCALAAVWGDDAGNLLERLEERLSRGPA